MKAKLLSTGEPRASVRRASSDAQPNYSVNRFAGEMPAQPDNRPRLTRIAERAHEIYERRGGDHGRALNDWLQAEREIDEEG